MHQEDEAALQGPIRFADRAWIRHDEHAIHPQPAREHSDHAKCPAGDEICGPREHATWTLPELHERLSEYLFEVYDTINHPALGQSPRAAFQAGFETTGFRTERMVPY